LAMLTLSTLAILGLEALFLYRPLFRRLERANRELILTGRTDSLTGCLNRRGFADEAQRMLAEARRDGTALGVVMIDIDRFKSINDTYGHAAGDQAIESIALTLGAHTRSNSVLCRMGGEEFAVILRDSTLHGRALSRNVCAPRWKR
jgi:diguanylate cyclase (GGDEF)-like protein